MTFQFEGVQLFNRLSVSFPDEGGKFLAESVDSDNPAELGAATNLQQLADAYGRGASLLAESMAEQQRWPGDAHVVMNTARHFLELKLKSLYVELGAEALTGKTPEAYRHDLLGLWHVVRAVFRDHWPPFEPHVPDPIGDATEAWIEELSRMDPAGETFRYVSARGGGPLITQPQTLDLIEIGERLNGLRFVLEGIADHIRDVKSGPRRSVDSQQEEEQDYG